MFDSLFGRGKSAPQPRPRPNDTSSTPNNSNANSNRGFSSNMELYTALFTDGYVLLPNMVEKPVVDRALRAINSSLGRNVPNREDMCPDVANTPAVSNLYNLTAVKGIMDQLLQENTAVGGGQIAIRFPGDNTVPAPAPSDDMRPPPNWEQHWHIDGLGDHKVKGRQSFFGDVRNFTALVGVVLQDATEEFMGNLVVYPGSHSELQAHFRKHGFEDLYRQGVQGLPRLTLSRHRQITAKAGDVVILNYCLAHSIAPNLSPQLRYNVYFRITSKLHRQRKHNRNGTGGGDYSNPMTGASMSSMHHQPAAMLDVWLEWPGLRSALPPQALPEAPTVSVGSPLRPVQEARTQSSLQKSQMTPADEEERQLALALERSKYEK